MPFDISLASPQQLALFDAAKLGDHNIIVEAVAGSGKTTTIVEMLKFIPLYAPGALSPKLITFWAYNKSIADTLKLRCPRHVNCSTFHSTGLRSLSRVLGKDSFEIVGNKVKRLAYDLLDKEHPDFDGIIRIVSMAKSSGIGISGFPDNEPGSFKTIATHYDLQFEEERTSLQLASRLLEASNRIKHIIDYDDMLYLCVKLNAPLPTQDWIFVDEAQDTNPMRLELVSRSSGPHTRICAVGDTRQAIYGFTGALSNSMSLIRERFGCRVYNLSVSYRCSRAVVAEARTWLTKADQLFVNPQESDLV